MSPVISTSAPPLVPAAGAPASRSRVAGRRTRTGALAAAAALALAGCGGNLLEATSANNADTFEFRDRVVYPISTAAPVLPTAISISDPILVGVAAVRPAVSARAVGGGTVLVPNFDFAIDVAADGRVRLIPSKLIAGLSTAGRQLRTGARVVDTPFDQLGSAPTGNYQNDSVTTVSPGQTIVLDLESAYCLPTVNRTSIFAKIVVDSVSSQTGGVHIRGRVDPNCGYRSLAPGRPTS